VKRAVLVFFISLFILSGCSLISEEPDYSKEKAEVTSYLEQTYGLQIGEVDVWYEKYENNAHGTKTGDLIAEAFDKRDPSLAIQIQKRLETGKFEDNFNNDAFELRQEVFNILEKYNPDNHLNKYQGIYPENISGPVLIRDSSTDLHLGVMYDRIDIDKQLEKNWLAEGEIISALIRYFETHPDSAHKEIEFSVDYMFYEKGNFDMDSYIVDHKNRGYFGTYEGLIGVMLDNYDPYIDALDEDDKPKVIFKYQIYSGDYSRITNVEDYKKAAHAFWDKWYPNGWER